jgi:nucleotide-binding universal stress UspA family protein
MRGIIVGVDGSGHSQRALEWAMKEAAVRHSPLSVVTVHQLVRGYSGYGVAYANDAELTEQAGKAATEEADKVAAELGDLRPESVTVQAISGVPAEVLLDVTKDADMIVLGSRGAGGFAQLMLGSVSAQVAHHAHCPVVIVPPDSRN